MRARDFTTRFVRRSVGQLVGRSVTLYFFNDLISLTSLLLPKWFGDIKYSTCPPARDFGSRISDLVENKQCERNQSHYSERMVFALLPLRGYPPVVDRYGGTGGWGEGGCIFDKFEDSDSFANIG